MSTTPSTLSAAPSAESESVAGTATDNPGTISDNVAVVQRFVDEVLNRGRFELLDELVDHRYHYIGPDGTELIGREALAGLLRGFRSGFSDLTAHIHAIVASNDNVAMTMMLTGTHDGDFDGVAPTGAHLELPLAIFATVIDGKITEDREYYDTATMLTQLGVA